MNSCERINRNFWKKWVYILFRNLGSKPPSKTKLKESVIGHWDCIMRFWLNIQLRRSWKSSDDADDAGKTRRCCYVGRTEMLPSRKRGAARAWRRCLPSRRHGAATAARLPSRRRGAAMARRRCCHRRAAVLQTETVGAANYRRQSCKRPRQRHLRRQWWFRHGKEVLLPEEGGGAAGGGLFFCKEGAPALQGPVAVVPARFLVRLLRAARWWCGGVSRLLCVGNFCCFFWEEGKRDTEMDQKKNTCQPAEAGDRGFGSLEGRSTVC
jgi:hypothetical protein